MFSLSDDYYQRKCYLKQEQVPTQSVMRNKMSPPLANVYFKSMNHKLKVLAGLEPPMKGGGADWFVPPDELLEGKLALKPIKKQFLAKLGFNGIDSFGEKIVSQHQQSMEEEEAQVLLESDINWKKTIEASCRQLWEDTSKDSAKQNTAKIQSAFHEFTTLYTTSITKIENLLYDATVKEIERVREETFQMMKQKYEELLKKQAIMLSDRYEDNLNNEKAKLKAQFIANVEESQTKMGERLHDIKVEKHMAIEKLRNLFECQNLACQVYVALKEREECEKEMEQSKHKHAKQIKKLKEQIALTDFEIRLAKDKERKRKDFNKIWQKKICAVVRRFQMFVSYCLNSLPDHAEFFLNMEKLMLLQLDEAMENPSAESIFVVEDKKFHTPVPRPHPFFLFCDKGYRPHLNQDLCPKHCTSSASQLPVIVVNKRCIYAACDNMQVFSDKIKQYIYGQRGDDADLVDDHDYTYNIPVTYTRSQQLLELKLESSLFQILQMEHPNLKQVQTECCICKVPHCFCTRLQVDEMPSETRVVPEPPPPASPTPSGNKLDTRSAELVHEREPKVESYIDYMEPKKCHCARVAKKNLREHMPAYMRIVSKFEQPELPNYEPCSVLNLKKLVKKYQGRRTPPEPVRIPSRTKDVSTQYSDHEFDLLCTCFSDEEIDRLCKELLAEDKPGDLRFAETWMGSPSNQDRRSSSFAERRAYSLRNLIADSPDLVEIFKKTDCNFDDLN